MLTIGPEASSKVLFLLHFVHKFYKNIWIDMFEDFKQPIFCQKILFTSFKWWPQDHRNHPL